MLNKQIGACCLLMVSAASLHAGEFIVRTGVNVESTDNARNAAVEALKIKENQTVASVSMAGEIVGRNARFTSDASYEVRRFSEQTNQNNELFLGSAALGLGDAVSRFYGNVSYRAEELLINSLLGDAAENLDRRGVASGMLGVRAGRHANRFSLYANLAETRLDVSSLNDSSRTGGGFAYHRIVSPLSTLGFELSGYTLDYLNTESGSFDYRRASASWATELRKLSYEVHVGRNSIKDDSSHRGSSPFYELGLDYDGAIHHFSLDFKQWLTDTSQGSAGEQSASASGGRLGVIDQYKRREGELGWVSSFSCSRCSARLILGAEREDYQREIQLDAQEYYSSIGFDYRARRVLTLDFSYEHRQVDFRLGIGDYTQASARAGLTWSEVFKYGRFRFYVEQSERSLDAQARDYDEAIIGASFDYQLYRR